jgi:hypothetical protein
MKKIYYLLAFAMLAFTACQKQPVVPVPSLSKTQNVALTFTLAPADYQLLPSTAYPATSNNFNSVTDADNYIPMILTAKEPSYVANGSTALVTYNLAPPSLKVADSLSNDISYTVASADYKATTGNNFGDFSASDVLKFVANKYPNPVANQLAVITYVLYTGVDNTVTNSFLYINGAWKLIYQVTPAQYASVGEGKFNQFEAADLSKLPGYLNFFLKNDITIADTAKAGDVEYVSYAYFASSKDYQKVIALTYDGNNWGQISIQKTASFTKTAGAWIAVLPIPTITHTLTSADLTLIANSSAGTAAQRSDVGKYSDFSGWSAADLNTAMILVLTADYPTPATKTNYNVIYANYTGGADVPTTLTFQWNGTAWAPAQ